MSIQKITPFLWFDTQAEEAARFYISIFENSKITSVSHYSDAGPGPKGSVMTVGFELEGQVFTALNGGPNTPFTHAVSFVVHGKDQKEVDYFWDKLLAGGGKPIQCGWLVDKFGLSWQVVPEGFIELLTQGDPAKSTKAMKAMFEMVKLDIDALRRALDEN